MHSIGRFEPECRGEKIEGLVSDLLGNLDRFRHQTRNISEEVLEEVFKEMPGRIRVQQRIIPSITVAVQTLRISEIRHDRVRRDKASQAWIIIAGLCSTAVRCWRLAPFPYICTPCSPASQDYLNGLRRMVDR